MSIQVFDVEVAPNWFLVLFKNHNTGRVLRWERFNDLDISRSDRNSLRSLLSSGTFVSFNGKHYDQWMLAAYLAGYTNKEIFELSIKIIESSDPSWMTVRSSNLDEPRFNHIDLMPIAPGVASLKIYGARIDTPTIQDLPYAYDAVLTEDEKHEAIVYCDNDLDLTRQLFTQLLPQIRLRKFLSTEYDLPLLSSSDPQIAQAVFKAELAKLNVIATKGQVKPKAFYRYDPPSYIHFQSNELGIAMDNAVEARFELSAKGSLLVPKLFKPKIKWKNLALQMGSGGLHSTEKNQAIEPTGTQYLCELDVAGFYPAIVIANKFAQEHLGHNFTVVYDEIMQRRLTAKRSGDKVTSDSLKICANSVYGHFNNRHSALYDPQLTIQTTVTGQLSLLMLIEQIGIKTACDVVSANTDGIVVLAPNQEQVIKMRSVCDRWEKLTKYELEETPYKAIYSKDVNNYLALKDTGEWKGKGVFADGGLSKNPSFRICTQAVKDYLAHGVPIKTTILDATNPADFMGVQAVNGEGAMWRGQHAGKTIRWYMGLMGSQVTRASNGYNIGNTEQAMLCNKMPKTVPEDIDYDWYIERAIELLESTGVRHQV